jgi:cbb3-type cytochrome oxidase subunit 1
VDDDADVLFVVCSLLVFILCFGALSLERDAQALAYGRDWFVTGTMAYVIISDVSNTIYHPYSSSYSRSCVLFACFV